MYKIGGVVLGLGKMLKKTTYRNPTYLTYVRSLPSVLTCQEGCDAHHIKFPGQNGTVKASDLYVFPLTREEHIILHQHGYKLWEYHHQTQWRYVAETLARAIEEGIFR